MTSMGPHCGAAFLTACLSHPRPTVSVLLPRRHEIQIGLRSGSAAARDPNLRISRSSSLPTCHVGRNHGSLAQLLGGGSDGMYVRPRCPQRLYRPRFSPLMRCPLGSAMPPAVESAHHSHQRATTSLAGWILGGTLRAPCSSCNCPCFCLTDVPDPLARAQPGRTHDSRWQPCTLSLPCWVAACPPSIAGFRLRLQKALTFSRLWEGPALLRIWDFSLRHSQ